MVTDQRIQEQEMATRLQEVAQLGDIRVGGETLIEDEVIGAIAGVAVHEIEGVASLGARSLRRAIAERVGGGEEKARGVEVEAGSREAILDLDLRVIYGFSIPEVVIKIRQLVAQRVLEMAGLITKEININVVGMEFPDKAPGRVE